MKFRVIKPLALLLLLAFAAPACKSKKKLTSDCGCAKNGAPSHKKHKRR